MDIEKLKDKYNTLTEEEKDKVAERMKKILTVERVFREKKKEKVETV